MEICDVNKCTACFSCVSVCPYNCISMVEDAYGEMHPVVNADLCKHCCLCLHVCPNNTIPTFFTPIKCYASWITDNVKREKCASGGIATVLSEYVIHNGGVVYGTAYDRTFTPINTFADTIEGLEKFKGSKYVQSVVGDKTFRDIKQLLVSGRQVLYISTPCQVAGLKNFLRKEYENLFTIDLICHGVCPTKWFKDEVLYVSKKNDIRDLVDVRFRGNSGKQYFFTLWCRDKLERRLYCAYQKSRYVQPYFAGFILGVSLRENCYSCNYARPERVGDMTIGDFLSLGSRTPFPYDVRHPSVVLVNNEKAERLYKEVCCYFKDNLISVEREYEERLSYKPSLLEPFTKHPLHDVFRKKVLAYGFVKAIRYTLMVTILKYRCVYQKKRLRKKVEQMLKKICHEKK